MAWDQLSINRPHLAYTILGGFTTIFMLVSLLVKEKLYIGEATVATICGIIFGPVGAGLFVPDTWGNVDQITLECARIVLVVQCFAVGVELPKRYMERHWKSVFMLLVPVMTYGWLITSLIIWWMIPKLTWLESLCCAACVTATDPVLASSVVGKGKFARRVPKHLRDLLSAESGCNDGMAFPFIYLALYIIDYGDSPAKVIEHWFVRTILYECLFGTVYGVCIGYAGRHAIKLAEKKNLIDRESFLVFYFVLALWCAGTGSMLGLDDLLVGFAAGVAFSNDGWFSQKTEESHVSNVIDLLLNLAFFVYFGAIIPWSSYSNALWEITPWRLVVIAIFVLLFRRIPAMLAFKPLIPDIKTWREALFAGHFGPIGVGAVFVAILARAELETGHTTPLAEMPDDVDEENYLIVHLIWPITSFLILTSIIIHGSSIAVFTLGKHINTMRISMSFTTANEEPNWLSRLPRLTPRPSMSMRKADDDDSDEKESYFPPGTLPPVGGIPGGIPAGGLLARRRSSDTEATEVPSRPMSQVRRKMGVGGPISDSAITPRRSPPNGSDEDDKSDDKNQENLQAFQEGHDIVIENEEGDVIAITKDEAGEEKHHHLGPIDTTNVHEMLHHNAPYNSSEDRREVHSPQEVVDEQSALAAARAEQEARANENGGGKHERRPAWAFRFDDNIIVEDEDGEVIRRYKLPGKRSRPRPQRRGSTGALGGWTEWNNIKNLFVLPSRKRADAQATEEAEDDDPNSDAKTVYSMHRFNDNQNEDSDKGVHFRMHDETGRRLSKAQFLDQLQKMDPHARAAIASSAQTSSNDHEQLADKLKKSAVGRRHLHEQPAEPSAAGTSSGARRAPASRPGETAASSETTKVSPTPPNESPALKPTESPALKPTESPVFKPTESPAPSIQYGDERDEETAAERKRREAALGISKGDESDSEDEGGEGRLERIESRRREDPRPKNDIGSVRSPGIRFAELTSPTMGSRPGSMSRSMARQDSQGITWGSGVKGKSKET